MPDPPLLGQQNAAQRRQFNLNTAIQDLARPAFSRAPACMLSYLLAKAGIAHGDGLGFGGPVGKGPAQSPIGGLPKSMIDSRNLMVSALALPAYNTNVFDASGRLHTTKDQKGLGSALTQGCG